MKTFVLFLLITHLNTEKTANGATINVLINVQKSNFTNGPENFGINQVCSLFQYFMFYIGFFLKLRILKGSLIVNNQ
jgi:hypothetical protein